jgi:hypothetical protein
LDLVFDLVRQTEDELVEPGEPGFLAFFLRLIFLGGFPSSREEVVLLYLILLKESDSDLAVDSGSLGFPAKKTAESNMN